MRTPIVGSSDSEYSVLPLCFALLTLPAGSTCPYNRLFFNTGIRCISVEDRFMKEKIHPKYVEVNVVCACGETFKTRSSKGSEIRLEICSKCHPFFTGKQKLIDTAGRVERFNRKYSKGKEPVAN